MPEGLIFLSEVCVKLSAIFFSCILSSICLAESTYHLEYHYELTKDIHRKNVDSCKQIFKDSSEGQEYLDSVSRVVVLYSNVSLSRNGKFFRKDEKVANESKVNALNMAVEYDSSQMEVEKTYSMTCRYKINKLIASQNDFLSEKLNTLKENLKFNKENGLFPPSDNAKPSSINFEINGHKARISSSLNYFNFLVDSKIEITSKENPESGNLHKVFDSRKPSGVIVTKTLQGSSPVYGVCSEGRVAGHEKGSLSECTKMLED